MPTTRPRPRVVIVGAGFGGLAAARGLARAPVEATVIDRHNYHLFQPLLYQVATAALAEADIAMPVRAILRDQRNARVLLDEVKGIDLAARQVATRSGAVHGYDYLVLATGSRYNYFGHKDWPELAPALKSLDDATLMRRRVLLAFEEAETTQDPALRQRLLTFVLVGAGPTGVELAGALAELARATLSRDFRHIDPRSARIILVEAGPRILGEFPEALSGFASRALEKMGVEIMAGTAIEAIDAHGVTAKGRHIDAANVLWCAGVAATPVAQWLGIPAARGGRVAVEADLSVPGHPEIFVIGDAALALGADGRPLPGLAEVAEQQGWYVARAIIGRVSAAQVSPFRYRNKGELATIGRSSAIANFGRIQLTGWIAWVLWGVVHIFFLIGFRNRLSVFLNWVWAWLTYGRGSRLITGEVPAAARRPTQLALREADAKPGAARPPRGS